MVSDIVQIGLIVVGGLTVVATAGVVVMGLMWKEAKHDQELNFREQLRAQKAIAIAQAEAGQGGEGNDLTSLLVQAAPLIQQFMAQKQGQGPAANVPTGEINNGS